MRVVASPKCFLQNWPKIDWEFDNKSFQSPGYTVFWCDSTTINSSQKIILGFQICFLTGGILGHSDSLLIFHVLYAWLLSTGYSARRVSCPTKIQRAGLLYQNCLCGRPNSFTKHTHCTFPTQISALWPNQQSDIHTLFMLWFAGFVQLSLLFFFFILDTTISVIFHMTNSVQHNERTFHSAFYSSHKR